MLDRQTFDAKTIGAYRPASFGLPPMVDDRDAQLLLGPGDGRRVGALAGQEQRPELLEIASPDQIAVPLDRTEGGRCRKEDPNAMLLDDPPEGAGIGRADRLALIHDRGAADQQRGV